MSKNSEELNKINEYISLLEERLSLLEKNYHTAQEFLLHEDFYDEETGEALQPMWRKANWLGWLK